jgi:hypothetical protein
MNGWQAPRARYEPRRAGDGAASAAPRRFRLGGLACGAERGGAADRRAPAQHVVRHGTALVLILSRLCDALALLWREGVARVTVLTDNEYLWVPGPPNRWSC